MEYQEYRAPPAVPACAEPLAQLTAADVGSPWQVPRSQPGGLAVALSVLEARRALWESIGAWEDLVGAVDEHSARAAACSQRGAAQTARRS